MTSKAYPFVCVASFFVFGISKELTALLPFDR
jgi:hypothetical protein